MKLRVELQQAKNGLEKIQKIADIRGMSKDWPQNSGSRMLVIGISRPPQTERRTSKVDR